MIYDCFTLFQSGPMEKLTHIELTDIQCQDVKARSFDVNASTHQVNKLLQPSVELGRGCCQFLAKECAQYWLTA